MPASRATRCAVRNNEFNHENLQLGINEAHALGKKFYVVVNIAPHNAS
ncbi:protease [Klebsiella pneumoniae]|uniref:Protease n=1 Tax=Klebsiella pneumoniae TaxID=573 RepID=A0A377TYD5_KLEPN|nr:protease [Klebsiella pneumoniae]